MKYEIHYSHDGGQIGPYQTIGEAIHAAMDSGMGVQHDQSAEIRPYDSEARGAYKDNNKGSTYVKKDGKHTFIVRNVPNVESADSEAIKAAATKAASRWT